MSNALASFASREPIFAQTDDQQSFAAQFILAQRQVADHAAPFMALLAVPPAVDVAREGQDQGHGMFADRVAVDAAGGSEADAPLPQRVQVKLVDAGADRLDESQAGRDVQEFVLPESGNQQHIRLRQTGGQICRCPDLEVLYTPLPDWGAAA